MGTHPIFESDFDCLTAKNVTPNRDRTGPAPGQVKCQKGPRQAPRKRSRGGKTGRSCPSCNCRRHKSDGRNKCGAIGAKSSPSNWFKRLLVEDCRRRVNPLGVDGQGGAAHVTQALSPIVNLSQSTAAHFSRRAVVVV